MTRPIVGFLAEFTAVERPVDVAPAPDAPAADHAADDADRLRGLIESARADGLAEGRRLAEAAAAEQRQALADEHAAALAAARAAWAQDESAALAEGLARGLVAIETTLGDNLAAVLRPFVDPAVRQQTVREIEEALAALMAGAHGTLVAIRGPAAILDPLRAAMADHPAVVCTTTEDVDVVVEAGDTTIRSQLQAWSDRFEKALLAA